MGLTNTIKNEFLDGNAISVNDLYKKFISTESSSEEIPKIKHRIRGVLSELKRQKFVTQLGKGVYIKN